MVVLLVVLFVPLLLSLFAMPSLRCFLRVTPSNYSSVSATHVLLKFAICVRWKLDPGRVSPRRVSYPQAYSGIRNLAVAFQLGS